MQNILLTYWTHTLAHYSNVHSRSLDGFNNNQFHSDALYLCTNMMMIYANSMRTNLIMIKKYQYDDDDVNERNRTHALMHAYNFHFKVSSLNIYNNFNLVSVIMKWASH